MGITITQKNTASSNMLKIMKYTVVEPGFQNNELVRLMLLTTSSELIDFVFKRLTVALCIEQRAAGGKA